MKGRTPKRDKTGRFSKPPPKQSKKTRRNPSLLGAIAPKRLGL